MPELPTTTLPALPSGTADEGLLSPLNRDNAMSDADLKRIKELQASFTKAIGEHHKVICKICFAWCHQRADQEDLYQEIVYQLWKSFPTFKADSQLSTWLHRVALRAAMLPYRRSKVDMELRDELTDQPSNGRLDDGMDDLMFRIFHQLEHIDRAVLVLTAEDYTIREIGVALRLTEKAVESRMKRIRDVAWMVK